MKSTASLESNSKESDDSTKNALWSPQLVSLAFSIHKKGSPGIVPNRRGDSNDKVNKMLSGFSLVGGSTKQNPEKSGTAGDTEQAKASDQIVKEKSSETKPLDPARFVSVAKGVLAKIEPGGKPVSKEALAKALENPSFKGEDAQALAAMYDSFEGLSQIREPREDFKSIQEIMRSKFSSKAEGSLSAADLDAYEKIRPEKEKVIADARAMDLWASDNIGRYGHDGGLSREDIKAAMDDKKTPEADRKILDLINGHFDELARGGKVLKERNFDDALDLLAGGGPDSNLVWRMESICRRTAKEAQAPGEIHDLYSTKNPLDAIKPDAIKQGAIGDCYFDSALAAVAKAHPELIRDSIKQNADGTFAVTFPGANDKPVTVKAPTEAELGLYNGASAGDGVWPLVMEKAFGELRKEHPELNFFADAKGMQPAAASEGTPEDSAGGGGACAPCLKLLTNHDTEVEQAKKTSATDMDKRFREAFSKDNPEPVTAEIKGDIGQFLGGPSTTANGFLKQHAYTIVDYVPNEPGGPYVVVRNPWGGKDGTTSGTIKISLSTFMGDFDAVSFAKN